ncbi:DUF2125 domain-containing protein [Pseudothioclava arenosa]|nr:DUF2125 domain-containing protein [Pseudothioclava arenosa]
MRRLIWVVLALSGLYAGYWALGAKALRGGAEAALVEVRRAGWGDAGGLSLAGFPSRFDLTLDAPRVTDPAGAFEWRAPVAQILALSYQPNRVIFWAPPEQELRLGGQAFTLTNTDMRASVEVGLNEAAPLSEATLVIETPALAGAQGALRAEARQLRGAIALAPAQPETPDAPAYRIGLELLDATSPALDDPIAQLTLDAVVSLTAPLDRHLAETQTPPRPEHLSLRRLYLDWAGKRLLVQGELTPDAAGYPQGKLVLESAEWRDWIATAEAQGLVPAKNKAMLLAAAESLARQSPDGVLRLPLAFRSGGIFFGPLALGPAPRLW